MDDALRSFDAVLAEKPTNVVALLGKVRIELSVMVNLHIDGQKARIVYAQRNYKEALRLFQDVLRYNPSCVPDPRIGIGLCFWAMDQKAKAKAAWHRSLEVVCSIFSFRSSFR
jgi:RNA polymerase-associated protein CTR9